MTNVWLKKRFKVGMTVVVGGKKMVIHRVMTKGVICRWLTGTRLNEAYFLYKEIKKV